MKIFVSLTIVFVASLGTTATYAQTSQRSVVIGTMTTRPNALLVLNPPGANQGFLLPQLTTSSRVSIRPSSPEEDGLLVFDINEKEFYCWKNNQWVKGLGVNNNAGAQTLSFDPVTRTLKLSNGNTVDLTPLQGIPTQTGNAGKVLMTNGTQLSWATPETLSLLNTGVVAGTYGDALNIAKFTVDAQGRITSASNVQLSSTVATPALQSYSIDPSDFQGTANNNPDKLNAVIFEGNTTFITIFRSDEGSMLVAPVHLPDGAVVQQVLLYYMDRDMQSLSATLVRRTYTGSNENISNTFTSFGASGSIQTQTLTPIAGKDVIDNSQYGYRVIVDLNPTSDAQNASDATQRVYGVQIKYIR